MVLMWKVFYFALKMFDEVYVRIIWTECFYDFKIVFFHGRLREPLAGSYNQSSFAFFLSKSFRFKNFSFVFVINDLSLD